MLTASNSIQKGKMRQAISYVIFGLILFLFAVLLSLNYSAGMALALGIVIPLLVLRLYRLITLNRKRIILAVFVGTIFLVGAIFLAPSLSLMLFPIVSNAPPEVVLDDYRVEISPLNSEIDTFQVKEAVQIHPVGPASDNSKIELPPLEIIDLPERKITSSNIGLLTREVNIMPIRANSSGRAIITLPDGSSLSGTVCLFTCPGNFIELHDFPRGSFLVAKNAANVEKYQYVDSETIIWSVISLDKGISFAYIPPPFHYVGLLIKPLAQVSSPNQWMIGLLGMIGSLVFTPIVKPVIVNAVQKRFGSWLEKRFGAKRQKQTKTKGSIVISGSGEEKDVEILGEERKR